MSENNQLRDVFDTIADPTRRRLIHLLAEAEEKPFHELTAQLHFAFQLDSPISYSRKPLNGRSPELKERSMYIEIHLEFKFSVIGRFNGIPEIFQIS
ncbi:MAG: hypothetical protein ACQEWW_14420 [Bacillota bacterium]